MEVRALLGGEVITVAPAATLREAAVRMVDPDIGSVAVMNGPKVVGILTERDLVHAIAAGADVDDASVERWMTASPDVIAPVDDVEDAADWMLATGHRHLPVMEGETLLGIVSIKDVLWALRDGVRS
ncbi:MAG TPA: CBS domain-containing protein [Acidimicrobiia bacterium]